MTDYLEFSIETRPFEPWADILCHELGVIGFESFELHEPLIMAYIAEDLFNEEDFQNLVERYQSDVELKVQRKTIASKNWNEEWESNFQPVTIADQIFVRAPFHEKHAELPYDIVLMPKMSFGTGHHPTTHMMMEEMLNVDFSGMSVLDAGCGTAILSILAEKRGAAEILAVDNDDWAVTNARENIVLNGCNKITVEKLDTNLVSGKSLNIILANINKNVILQDIALYNSLLRPGSHLLLSGFMPNDVSAIEAAMAPFELNSTGRKELGEWCMWHFTKKKI